MKTHHLYIALLSFFVLASVAEAKTRGPHGGRIIETSPGHAEVLITPEQTVAVYFYDDAMKPVDLPEAEVEIITQTTPRQKFSLAHQKDFFTSQDSVSADGGYQVVVRLKTKPVENYTNHRFLYDTAICGGCKLQEYACHCEDHQH